jgi:carbonic anhydrase
VNSAHGDELRTDLLCELNVIEQVVHVCQTSTARDAWQRGQPLNVHSWIYGLKDGLIRNLGMNISRLEELTPQYHAARAAIAANGPFTAKK